MPLTISLPDQWTIAHWVTYTNGRSTYIVACERDNTTPNGYLADYHGALALIRAGIVHVRGHDDDPASQRISQRISEIVSQPDQSLTELPIMGVLVREIARPIEAALTLPLDRIYSSAS